LATEVVEEYVEKPEGFWNSETNRYEYERFSVQETLLQQRMVATEPPTVVRDLDDPNLNSDDDVPEQREVLKSENFGFVLGTTTKVLNKFERSVKRKRHLMLEVFFCSVVYQKHFSNTLYTQMKCGVLRLDKNTYIFHSGIAEKNWKTFKVLKFLH